jgi:sulfur carrier protein ThiS
VRIRVKLMGLLKGKCPPDGQLEVAEQSTIADVLHQLEVSPNSVQVFSVNGQLERDLTRKLSVDDELSIIPPVGGG